MPDHRSCTFRLLTRLWLALVVVTLACTAASASGGASPDEAQPAPGPLLLAPGDRAVPLGRHLLVLSDPDGGLALSDVLDHPGFAPPDRTKARGGTIWYKATVVRDPLAPADWVLAFGEPHVDDVRVFVVGPDRALIGQSALGRHLPTRALEWSALRHVAGLALPAGEEVSVYLRLSSVHKIRFENAALWLPRALVPVEARAAGQIGIITGALTMLVILYGLFGTWMRNGAMMSYAAFVGTVVCGHLVHSGFGPLMDIDLSDGDLTILRRMFFLGGAATFTIMWTFILDLRSRLPVVHGLYLLIAFVLAALFVTVPAQHTGLLVRLSQGVMLLVSVTSVAICMARLWQKPRNVVLVLYLIAFLPVVPAWFAMVTTPLVPIVPEGAGRFLHSLSIPVHVGVLAFALAFQLRQTARAKADAESALAGERIARDRLLTFVEMANHEFKTPLATIDAAAQTIDLRARLGRTDVTSQVEAIQRASRRLVMLIQACLTAERDASPTVVKRQTVPTADLIARVVDHHPGGDRHRLDVVLTDLPAACTVDPDLLVIAIEALVDNARRFSPGDQPITLGARVDGATLTISVADRGPGVPEAEAEAIFDRYYRSASTSSVPGTGVGLFLVRTIADLHDGWAGYTPRPGGGAVFTITLPIEPGESTKSMSTVSA